MEKSSRRSSVNQLCHWSTKSNREEEEKHLECSICFESPKEAVVSRCGHLFCWSCLYIWLHLYSQTHQCPVCKSPIDHRKLIPLYSTHKVSSHSTSGIDIPSRPTRQISSRTEFFSRRQLRFSARKFEKLIIILLCGVVVSGLVILCLKIRACNLRYWDHRWVLYKHESVDYNSNQHIMRGGLLQSSSFRLQLCLFLFVASILVAIEL